MDGSIELRLVHLAQKVASMYKDKIEQKYYKQLCDAIETCRDYYINGGKDWGCISEDGITPEDLELRGENIPAFVELLEKHINQTIGYDKIFQFWGSGICY